MAHTISAIPALVSGLEHHNQDSRNLPESLCLGVGDVTFRLRYFSI